MALADTAKLFVESVYKDGLSKGVASSIKSVDKLQGSVGRVGSIAAKGFRTLGQNIKNVLTGPVGLIGLGAGILGITNFLKGSIDKAREFGEAVFRVKAIIGGTTQQVSQLVDVLGDYGIESEAIVRIGGMFEKNIGNIAKSTKLAAKFQEEYGFSILDSTGKAKDFNTVLLEAADIFTSKTIPQSQKAALLSKLYGRNWQELVPILAKGRAELEKTLSKGITLTDDQAKSMERARKAGIRWEDAIGDLQVMIGIELLPAITKMVNRLTNFVQEHGDEIRKFFRDAAKFAEGMGRAIKNDVLPFIQKIGEVWAGVPDDLKKILIGGFILNKATGGAITGLVGALAEPLVKKVLGITAGVVNIKAGVVNGGGAPGAGAAPAAAGAGIGTTAAVGGLSAALIAGPIVQQLTVNDANAELQAAGIEGKLQAMQNAWDFGALFNNLGVAVDGLGKVMDGSVEDAQRSQSKADAETHKILNTNDHNTRTALGVINTTQRGTRTAMGLIRPAIAAGASTTRSAIANNTASNARNLDQVTSAIQRKKLAVNVDVRQRQAQAIRANIAGTSTGKSGFLYTKSNAHELDIRRVLAKGAVGVANTATPAIFGEAGPEAYAILKNPRKGMLGGGAPTVVNVTVNIDPRRITKKQTSSGVYKTYVAT